MNKRRENRSDDHEGGPTTSHGKRSKNMKKMRPTPEQHEGDLRKHLQKMRHKKAARGAHALDLHVDDTDTDMATDDTDSIASTASAASKTETKTTKTGMSPLNRRKLQLRPGESRMDAATAPHPALLARVSTTYFLRSQMAVATLDRSETVEMASPTKATPLERMETTGRWENWRWEEPKQGPVKSTRASRNQAKPYGEKPDKSKNAYAKLLTTAEKNPSKPQTQLKRKSSKSSNLTSGADNSKDRPKLSGKKSTTAGLRRAIANQELAESGPKAVDGTDGGMLSESTVAGVRLKRKATTLLSPIAEGSEAEGKKSLTKGRNRKVRIVTPEERASQRTPSPKRQATVRIEDLQSPGTSGSRQAKRLCVSSVREPPTSGSHGDRERPPYIPPRAEWPVTMSASMVWRMSLPTQDGQPGQASSLFVSDTRCLVALEDRSVVCLDTTVQPMQTVQTYKLPSGVQSLVADGEFLYAGCKDGSVYDISHKEPRLVLQIEMFGEVECLEVYKGQVAVSDQHTSVAMVTHSGDILWAQQSKGYGGTMVKIDDTGLYHCHGSGVTKYSLRDGTQLWHAENGCGTISCQVVGDHLFAAPYSRLSYTAQKIDKHTGAVVFTYGKGKSEMDMVNSLTVTDQFVIAAGNNIVCYDIDSGEAVYVIKHPFTSTHIQYHQGRLLCVGQGNLTVLDLTENAVQTARQGLVIEAAEISMAANTRHVVPLKRVATVTKEDSQSEGGVLVECVKPTARKGKLLVKAISSVQNKSWAVQLSPDLQRPGARYVVQELKPCPAGYYRVYGDIKEVE